MVANKFAEPLVPRANWGKGSWNDAWSMDPWQQSQSKGKSGSWSKGDPWSGYNSGKGKGSGSDFSGGAANGGTTTYKRKGLFCETEHILDMRHPSQLDSPWEQGGCSGICMMVNDTVKELETKSKLQQVRPCWIRVNRNWRKSAILIDMLQDVINSDQDDDEE